MIVTKLNHDNTWMYNACPKDDCKKKVTADHAGGWRCEKCNQVYPECNPRYVLSFTASDATGRLWVSAFNAEAEQMLGRSAKELVALQETDPKAFEAVFDAATYCTVRARIRARSEEYQEQRKVKHSLLSVAVLGAPSSQWSWASAAADIAQKIEALG